MANMSYCRFRNTLKDLRDCEEHMEDDIDNREEANARKALFKMCKRIAENYSDYYEDTEEEETEE